MQTSIVMQTPKDIQQKLYDALEQIEPFKHCALLSFPDHYNVGDHLIWLGQVFYLRKVLNVDISYASSIEKFSPEVMQRRLPEGAPLLICGGGNLGDVWSYYQRFYERIVREYPNRRIIIFSQAVKFRYPNRLEEAKSVFNSHPDLTIFIRDHYSYAVASEHFSSCKVLQAPDMAFALSGLSGLKSDYKSKSDVLYHCRNDHEFNREFDDKGFEIDKMKTEDWQSFRFKGSPRVASVAGVKWLFQYSWEQGQILPFEWVERQYWQRFHRDLQYLKDTPEQHLHLKSWMFMHHGVYQFKKYRLIVTNRLHGHILATLMEIPHVFLANSYHKNLGFYETWTGDVPYCRFVKDPSNVARAAKELMLLT